MQKRLVILEHHKREPQKPPSKTEQFKNIALGVAGIVTSIAIPIVGLWLGYIQKDKEVLIANAQKNQELQKSYVELGIRVLSDPPKPQSQPLREWAVKLINAHTEVALDEAAASAVVSDVPLTVTSSSRLSPAAFSAIVTPNRTLGTFLSHFNWQENYVRNICDAGVKFCYFKATQGISSIDFRAIG